MYINQIMFKRKIITLITIVLATAMCRGEGDVAELSITVTPDPSYTYWDKTTGMVACTTRVRIEEKGGVGVRFLSEHVEYMDLETHTIFRRFAYNEDDIKEYYGSNYLPAGAWVEFEITDFVDLADPQNFYVIDTLSCVDDKENYFTVSITRTCLSL